MNKSIFQTIKNYSRIDDKTGLTEGNLQRIRKASGESIQFICAMLKSTEWGITNSQALERLRRYGFNEIDYRKPSEWYHHLLNSFINPFIGILFIIGIVSLITDVLLSTADDRDFSTIIIVSIMIVLSAFIRFWQEYGSNKAAERLRRMVNVQVTVSRKLAGRVEVPLSEIVPGDLIHLSAGDIVPADCRLTKCKDLYLNQSTITGESLPREKNDVPDPLSQIKSLTDLDNIALMGTYVVSGTAEAIVVNTGKNTYFGAIGKSLSHARTHTAFDLGINKVSYLLIRFMLVMVPLIFVINGIVKGDWLEAFLFGIAVAVGLTPEMLPMIVSANLAKGSLHMSREKVIVKRQSAIQNFGAMDILCTDKTGTLTLDKVVLETHRNTYGHEDDEVLKWAYLNSYFQTGLKNLLDRAVLEHIEEHPELENFQSQYQKVDEIPFDFQRRRMSVILQKEQQSHLMICKGALDEMLAICTYYIVPDENTGIHENNLIIEKLTDSGVSLVRKSVEELNAQGMRVLLVAIREFAAEKKNYAVADECNLVLTGFIGFFDPPKPTAQKAIADLTQLGVQVKILTGDNELVTKKICKQVGIMSDRFISGSDIENTSDETLKEIAEAHQVFVRLTPHQKVRIVQALKNVGKTVGYLGDGINDAGAIQHADVGISVDTAADIAKESADIILLEKDLDVLRKGIEVGRLTFGNIMKYLKMTASSNFGNVFSVLGASAFLPFLPMLPIHLLIQNLLYDISQISIPWDKMDKEFLQRPRKWSSDSIRRFMLYIGPVSSIFDYTTFALMYFYFQANAPESQNLFQSGWFVEGLLSQTLIVHIIRTRKIPFVQSWATAPVVILTGCIMTIGIIIPFTNFGASVGFVPLPGIYFLFLVLTLISYAVLAQIVKVWYIRKFDEWL